MLRQRCLPRRKLVEFFEYQMDSSKENASPRTNTRSQVPVLYESAPASQPLLLTPPHLHRRVLRQTSKSNALTILEYLAERL